MSEKVKKWIAAIVSVVAAILVGATVVVNITNGEPTVTIKYAEESVPAVIETEDGKEEVIDIPTVEFVDSEVVAEDCNEEDGCLGQGAGSDLSYLDISTPTAIMDSLLNRCVDFDGWFGSQCVDPVAYFHYIYTGRWLSTNGTGSAYGIWDARDYNNLGNEYVLSSNPADIIPGAVVVFHNGVHGHVGFAMGKDNNGYVVLLGANQGGSACPGGGAAVNLINMSLATFSGVLIPRIYVQPDPAPEPTPEPTENYIYKKGDTFGQVLLDLGLSDGTDLWGADGKVNYYNEKLYKQGILNYYDGKYWNNIPIGTELVLEEK